MRTKRTSSRHVENEFSEHFAPVIDQMIANGKSFSEVEDYINALPVSEEHKNVLWLLAWGAFPQSLQRAILFGRDLLNHPLP